MFGIVWTKNLYITIKKIATVVNENIVHHKLIAAMSNIIGMINTGNKASNATCLAPPFHGSLSLSCMVLTSPALVLCDISRQVIILKYLAISSVQKIQYFLLIKSLV